MTSLVKLLRTMVAGTRPAGQVYGVPYVNFADKQFGVFDNAPAAQDLIGVPFFSAAASYAIGQPVNHLGNLYLAIAAVSPGAWTPAAWSPVVPEAPNDGNPYARQSLAWAAAATLGLLYNYVTSSGRLAFVSSTALGFTPAGGNQLKINGVAYAIPSAGIAGLGNTGVFVNGVAGQNLAANTNYWVFAFVNAGVATGDFRTAATHAPSVTAGNKGVEILTGDDTRSLIGMCRTSASSQFSDTPTLRFVISWFNRRRLHLLNTFSASRATTSTTQIELNPEIRCEFLCWADDVPDFSVNASSYPGATANYATYTTLGFDAGFERSLIVNQAETINQPLKGGSVRVTKPLSEGYHYATLVAYVAPASTGTWDARCTVNGTVVG